MAYSLLQWMAFFYFYSFLGWIWESSYVSARKKHFVNRGFLHLPLLPLYGSGAVLVLFVTLPVRDNPVLVYLTGAVSATVLEYITGVAMETLYKVRYWDYSRKKYNLQGIICLESTVFWGFLTIVLVYAAHKPVEQLISATDPAALTGIDSGVSVIFLCDFVISNREALRLAHVLAAIEKAKLECQEEFRELELQLAEQRNLMEGRIEFVRGQAEARIDEIKERADAQLDELKERADAQLDELKERADAHKAEIRSQTEAHMDAARWQAGERSELLQKKISEKRRSYEQKREALLARADTLSAGILRRNPAAASRRYGETIRELHSRIQKLHRK